MNISYENTRRDVIAFCVYHYPRTPRLIGLYLLIFAGVGAMMYTVIPPEQPLMIRIIVLIIMVMIVGGSIVGFSAIVGIVSAVANVDKTMLTRHQISVSTEGLIEETELNKTEHPWTGILKVAKTRRYIFIYAHKHAAHVVPRRAFGSDEECIAFYDFCREQQKFYNQALDSK